MAVTVMSRTPSREARRPPPWSPWLISRFRRQVSSRISRFSGWMRVRPVTWPRLPFWVSWQ